MEPVEFTDLGLRDYKETWDLQLQALEKLVRAKTGSPDPDALPCLYFVEHPNVYTLGKSGHENNLLIQPPFLASIGATYYRIDRGGDITYHGPGQIVGYPIFDLDRLGIGVKKYIDKLEEAIILTLAEYSIAASRIDQATGVWLGAEGAGTRKICAIGVRVSRGVTMHGFALNVNTDLSYFNHINPCGFTDKGVTSMQKELGAKQDMDKVKQRLLQNLVTQFGLTIKGRD
jgi:lipoyl(octanoyl) transferase